MYWISVLCNLIVAALLYWFFKHLFPSYLNKKGENLATKEDIEEITRKSEAVQAEFRKDFEQFSSDIHFKYDFYFRQYTELYAELYAIICQSEYSRRFFQLYNGQELTFEDVPFVEIHKRRTHDIAKWGAVSSFEHTEEDVTDGITTFCKERLCALIIEKGSLAFQSLLKLSVAYRFAYDNYSGNHKNKNSDVEKIANSEEFVLIAEIVKQVVKDYNFLRRELKMEYELTELETGIFKSLEIG